MRSRAGGLGLALVLGAATIGGANAAPQSGAAAAKPSGIAWIHLAGDLDSSRIVKQVAAALERARDERVAAVVLELDANSARPDVAWPIAQLVRESEVPISAFLRDNADRRVGLGACAIALCCRTVVIDPATAVRTEEGDQLRALVGTDDAEAPVRRLAGAVHAGMISRGASAALTEFITGFQENSPTTWAVISSGASAAFVNEEPRVAAPAVAVKVVASPAQGPACLSIDAATAEKIGLVGARASADAAAMRAMGLGGTVKQTARIEGGIQRQHAAAAQALVDADAALERAKAALDLPDPPDAATSADRYRRAAKTAAVELDAAGSAIAACERLLEEVPELLELPAPGQTTAGASRTKHATKWRSVVQARRDRLAKLATRAELFRTQ